MDVVWLSRLQFAVATYFHFLFVPLTLGLSVLIAIMETRYAWRGDKECLRMTRFWSKFFLINFALGVVSGITLEFQFGTNWSRYSEYVGDIFGPLLAIEVLVAFFLESTFIGVWIFGWTKLSAKAHAVVMWLVAGAASVSTVWIITANAWMQHPVGYEIRNGRAELTDFTAILLQPTALLMILHTVAGAYVLSAFFVMGICAYHLLRKQEAKFFKRSFGMALSFALISSLAVLGTGHLRAGNVAKTQPAKFAAMEAHWETTANAPIYLFLLPDEAGAKNSVQIGRIPGGLSLLAFNDPDAEVKGLRDFPKEDRPPVWVTFISFRLMVALGVYFVFMSGLGWFKRKRIEECGCYLKAMLYSMPLAYIAVALGWTVAEVGRQPWIVYGLLRTRDAVSPIAGSQVAITLAGFVLLYSLLGLAGFWLMARAAKKGPDSVEEEAALAQG